MQIESEFGIPFVEDLDTPFVGYMLIASVDFEKRAFVEQQVLDIVQSLQVV